MTDFALAAALVGFLVGAWFGVRWAERRRAWHDIRKFIRKTWKERNEYRRR